MDLLLQAWTAASIESAKLRHMLGAGDRWKPGRPLRLLFAGYNGARNTGSDVRVEEMLRQVRQVLGSERVELAVLTQDFALTKGYFGDARQIRLPDIFPPFLAREVPRHDGVITCEGSMFKSKFADALTTMMIGALGLASARNRLSVGYGAEAGRMNRIPRRMTRRYVKDSLILTRNPESQDILGGLGVPTEPGTDTAWTFEPHPPEHGEKALRAAGWDGRQPVLGLCPIHPFWWPVRASLPKAIARLFGGYRASHYRSVYFHNAGPEVDRAYERYLGAIARAVADFRKRTPVFPVLIAMEQLDTRACRRLGEMLGGAPIFSSSDHDMYSLVSILRACSTLVSSRYHGIVTCMPALVASAGITMDERIRNLLKDRGHEHLLLEVDDPDLEPKLGVVLDTLHRDRDLIREGIAKNVATQLRTMARMGVHFEDHVRSRYPEFPTRSGVHSWEEYLPPLAPGLRRIVEAHPA